MNLPTQIELATLAAALPPTADPEARTRDALALWHAAGVALAEADENQRTRRPLADVLAEALPKSKRPDREKLYLKFRESKASKPGATITDTLANLPAIRRKIAEEERSGVTPDGVLEIKRELPAWVAERKAKVLKARAIKGGQARAAKKAAERKKTLDRARRSQRAPDSTLPT